MRVSRVDFAVDMLAPWFEPDRNALVAPPGTKAEEYTGIDETPLCLLPQCFHGFLDSKSHPRGWRVSIWYCF